MEGLSNLILFALFILAVSVGSTFAAATNPTPTKFVELENGKLVPDIIDEVPNAVLGVKYGNLEVKLGNLITRTQTKNPPSITWNADPGKYYLLSMMDAEINDPNIRAWNHWIVGNIPSETEVSNSETLVQYVPAGPGNGTGLHLYLFLLYEQPGKLTFDEKRLTNRSVDGRAKFSIRDFSKKYKLALIAGNFFQSEYDDYVPLVYKQLGIA